MLDHYSVYVLSKWPRKRADQSLNSLRDAGSRAIGMGLVWLIGVLVIARVIHESRLGSVGSG